MRPLVLACLASAALLAPLGLALSMASPAPTALKAPRPAPTLDLMTGVADFPNCPAPAVNGMNIRAVATADGVVLTIFVVVQNVGNRAFFAAPGSATLHIAQNGRPLGSFALERLAAGEVKFFSVAGAPGPATAGDVVAAIDFAASVPVGRVANTLDCQTSDNRSVRKGQTIRVSLGRAAS